MTIPTPIIIDISEHQDPNLINYSSLSQVVSGVIVRVQYGGNRVDKVYRQHIENLKKYNVPFGVYAWVRGVSNSDMESEAIDFYNRCSEYNPSFYWLDVEEISMSNMREGINYYKNKLKSLGVKKVGLYIAHHLYSQVNPDLSQFDGVWVPYYGRNDGSFYGQLPTVTNQYNIVQYTDKGRLGFYSDNLDLDVLINGDFNYFFDVENENVNNTIDGGFKVIITTTCDNVRLRNSPNALENDSNLITYLPSNTTLIINNLIFNDGFVWAVQPREDGSTGYIDIGLSVDWVK